MRICGINCYIEGLYEELFKTVFFFSQGNLCFIILSFLDIGRFY